MNGPSRGLPGTAILGFLAGASVVRRAAFLEAGGFDPRYFIGGEEELLALDLSARGWRMVYVPDIVVEHAPSQVRDRGARSRLVARNALYTALLRLPWAEVGGTALRTLRDAARIGVLATMLRELRAALPWLLAGRSVVPAGVLRARRLVRSQAARRFRDVPRLRAATGRGEPATRVRRGDPRGSS